MKQAKGRAGAVRGMFASMAALAAFGVGVTAALFWATDSSGQNQFASGTVTVDKDGASTTCNVAGLVPGDSSAGYGNGSLTKVTCTYNVKYTGASAAWLAADLSVGNGSTALYLGDSGGIQFKVKAGTLALMTGTSFKDITGASTTVQAGTAVNNILLNDTPAQTNDTLAFTVDYLLPLAAANALQGGSSTMGITFHAVQSTNMPIGACVAGRQCNTITWS